MMAMVLVSCYLECLLIGVAALVESREEENRRTTPFMEIDGGIELVLCQLPRCLLLEQQLGILQR